MHISILARGLLKMIANIGVTASRKVKLVIMKRFINYKLAFFKRKENIFKKIMDKLLIKAAKHHQINLN